MFLSTVYLSFIKKEKVKVLEVLGASFEELSSKEKKDLKIEGGVKVTKLFDGKLKKNTGIREGFIIIKIDNRKITSVDELVSVLESKKGGILIEGIYPGYSGVFYYGLGM